MKAFNGGERPFIGTERGRSSDAGVSVTTARDNRGAEGAVTSVGSRGDSYDNALAESVIGLYKSELIFNRAHVGGAPACAVLGRLVCLGHGGQGRRGSVGSDEGLMGK
jgi:transposase InsO family protein